MKKLFLLVSSLVLAAPSPEQTANFGLDEAKKHAIGHNFEVLALRKAVEETRATARRSRAPYFPTIGLAGGADTEITSTTHQTVSVGYLYGTYNLFNGFNDSYRVEIADTEADKMQVRLERTEFRVGLDVEQVFHLYLFKKGALKLREEALKLNDAHKRLAQQRRASGMSSEADVAEFDLRDALLRSDILLLQQELENARSQLKRLLGEEVGTKIEPVGTLQHQHLKGSLMDYVNRIKDQSEVVMVSTKTVQAAAAEAKIWRARWFPRLDLDVKAGNLPLELRPTQGGTSLTASIVARFDLFSGFDTIWQKRETEAKLLRSEAQLKNALLTAITDTEVAYRKIKTIQARVDLEEENATRSDRYYKAVMSEYKRGVKNSADLKVAAEQLYEIHLRQESYKYDFLNERISLERALGGRVETEMVKEQHEHKAN